VVVDLERDHRRRSPRGSIHAYSYGELAGCHRGWRGAQTKKGPPKRIGAGVRNAALLLE
jgi:hypothetical protein